MATSQLLTTIRSRFRLFKQPHKMGDTTVVDGKLYLIIGIERFDLYGSTLSVWYTAQDLSQSDYISHKQHAGWDNTERELYFQMKHDNDRCRDIHLGSTYGAPNGNRYKLIEFTEVSLKGTDVYVAAIGKLVQPVSRKEAKAKFTQERKKRLKLEVF